MNVHRIALSLLLLQLLSSPCFSQSRSADVGPEALYRRSMDTQSRLVVLSISLQPGYEDLTTLAYFRFGKGAQVVSAYVTNGEAGESDLRGDYPLALAATKRSEATQAMTRLGSEAYFLNLPDIAAASDTARVRHVWSRDTLQLRLMRVIAAFRPDIILLTRDWQYGSASARWQVLRADLMRAVQRVMPPTSVKGVGRFEPVTRWPVERVWIDDGRGRGVHVPANARDPFSKKSYRAFAAEAAAYYAALIEQMRVWGGGSVGGSSAAYQLAFPRSSKRLSSLDAGLPGGASPRLRGIERGIAQLTRSTLQLATARHFAGGRPVAALRRMAALMDSLDLAIASSQTYGGRDRRILLNWKVGLERLRCTALGVSVHYSLADSILTDRQLTFLRIDTIDGLPAGGGTDIFFPFVQQDWVVNETVQRRMPIDFSQPYRLLSPKHVPYNFPFEQYGLSQSEVWNSIVLFIAHQGARREENFVDRITLPLLYSPRFSVQVVTPIVRVAPSERVVVKLTNFSRDGVRDTIRVQDSTVVSTDAEFRLNTKDQSELDTLLLTWKQPLRDGTYLFPIEIGGETVAKFAARQFEVNVDSSKEVGFITGIEDSPVAEALRRMGVRWRRIDVRGGISQDLASCQALVIDRRAMTLVGSLKDDRSALNSFVERGGHLIILSQDAAIWNESPLVEGMRLTPSPALDELSPVQIDSTSRFATVPNKIGEDAWSGWLYQRAYNVLSGKALGQAEVVVRSSRENDPLVAVWRRGQGSITYCDLALHLQLLDIHPGAFQLLANMLSN
jgi:hypothetical protein